MARLEEFPRNKVESAGERQVVQYRGQIMPLIRVAEAVGSPGDNSQTAADDEGQNRNQVPLQVVVYAEQGRSVGLVVERVLDIVEEDVMIERMAERAGILGSAVVQQRVTDLLDVPALLAEQRLRGFEGVPA